MYGGSVIENDEGDGLYSRIKVKKEKIICFTCCCPFAGGCFEQIKVIVGIIKDNR